MLTTPSHKPREVQRLFQDLQGASAGSVSPGHLSLCFSCLSHVFHLLGQLQPFNMTVALLTSAQNDATAHHPKIAELCGGLEEMKVNHNTAGNNFKLIPGNIVPRKSLAILHHMGTFHWWRAFMDHDVLPCSWDLQLSPLTSFLLLLCTQTPHLLTPVSPENFKCFLNCIIYLLPHRKQPLPPQDVSFIWLPGHDILLVFFLLHWPLLLGPLTGSLTSPWLVNIDVSQDPDFRPLFKIFVYFTASGLSCGTWALHRLSYETVSHCLIWVCCGAQIL